VRLLLKYGFYYESSMMGNDHTPYRVRQGDKVHQDRGMEFGHVIGRGHRMLMLEGLLEGLAKNGAVFTTLEAAAREYDERVPFKAA
jgi:hypothetical protein